MLIAEITGYIAAILAVIAFVSQMMKSWKTKSTKDISLGMYSFYTLSQIVWITYGILIKAMPIIIVGVILFTLSTIILLHKIEYK